MAYSNIFPRSCSFVFRIIHIIIFLLAVCHVLHLSLSNSSECIISVSHQHDILQPKDSLA